MDPASDNNILWIASLFLCYFTEHVMMPRPYVHPIYFLFIYATADEAVAYMFYKCFFLFFPSAKNMRQPYSGTAERIFMKLLPNDTGKNGVCNVVPPLGECRAAAWRMANVDDLRNLRYDSGAITRGRHARRLRYKS